MKIWNSKGDSARNQPEAPLGARVLEEPRPKEAGSDYSRARLGVIVILVVVVVPVVIAISRYDNSTFIDRPGRTTQRVSISFLRLSFASPSPLRRSVYGARREGDSRRLDET